MTLLGSLLCDARLRHRRRCNAFPHNGRAASALYCLCGQGARACRADPVLQALLGQHFGVQSCCALREPTSNPCARLARGMARPLVFVLWYACRRYQRGTFSCGMPGPFLATLSAVKARFGQHPVCLVGVLLGRTQRPAMRCMHPACLIVCSSAALCPTLSSWAKLLGMFAAHVVIESPFPSLRGPFVFLSAAALADTARMLGRNLLFSRMPRGIPGVAFWSCPAKCRRNLGPQES